jgi:nucleoside 2-deoxyribosyltransferase
MLTIVGGVYRERCLRPNWDEFYGSAGRAASAITKLGGKVVLHSYLTSQAKGVLDDRKVAERFDVCDIATTEGVSFYYEHGLARPKFRRPTSQLSPLQVKDDHVLRYGMMEGTAIVHANYAVFDPQNVDGPESFHQNGSTANHLALVLNRYEARALLGAADNLSLDQAAQQLAQQEKAEVVIIKCGPQGALVWHNGRITQIHAYETTSVWKIGSGDQFAANFAYAWMEEQRNPVEAADRASRATAFYCQHLGFPTAFELNSYKPDPILVSDDYKKGVRRKVYLAGPFFTLGELWVVDQARRSLLDMGLDVFSPYHDVGPGDAADVVPKDIEGIRDCDLLLAVMDGTDAGTVFEVGFAHREGKPVIVYAENETTENCKMMVGSGCFMREDFVSAIYKTAWVAASL